MASLSIPFPINEATVLLAFHLGTSIGWHSGTAFSLVEDLVRSNEEYSTMYLAGLWIWKTFQHYDIGIVLVVVASGLLTGVSNWPVVGLFTILGVGGGLAYSDREDNPPEGIMKYTLTKIRSMTTGTT